MIPSSLLLLLSIYIVLIASNIICLSVVCGKKNALTSYTNDNYKLLTAAVIIRGGGDYEVGAEDDEPTDEVSDSESSSSEEGDELDNNNDDADSMLQHYYQSFIHEHHSQSRYNLKRGTRTTGAGASKRNPSIFSTSRQASSTAAAKGSYTKLTVAALSGDISNINQSTQSQSSKNGNGKHTKSIQHTNNNNPILGRLWVQQTKFGSLVFKFPRIRHGKDICIELSEPSTSFSKSANTKEDSNAKQSSASTIHVKHVTNHQQQNTTNTAANNNYIPIEGIYGIYNLPYSGPHVVLITESEEIYTSPSTSSLPDLGNIDLNTDRGRSARPLLELRRVKSMEIISLRGSQIATTSSNASQEQLDEEIRQLKLLRKSFKEHDLFFTVPRSSSLEDEGLNYSNRQPIVRDVTHSLQRSFVDWMSNEDAEEASNSWWVPYISRDGESAYSGRQRENLVVDPRFFWNEQSAVALLPPLTDSMSINGEDDESTLSPYTILLDHIIPVTSAFVGVQRNIPIPSSSTSTTTKATSSSSDVSSTEKYDQLLISRRSKYRTGTRFTRRGADDTGAVANYAETEQICFIVRDDANKSNTHDDNEEDEKDSSTANHKNRELLEVYSHIQTRGSIPLHWSSPCNIKEYRPRVYIGVDPIVQARGLRDHLLGELWQYSTPFSNSKEKKSVTIPRNMASSKGMKITMVNLIDKHGDQGRLGHAFDSVLSAVLEVYGSIDEGDETSYSSKSSSNRREALDSHPILSPKSVEHIWYDFHAECKGGRWDRLSHLLEEVMPTMNKQGYFSAVPSSATNNNYDNNAWEVLSRQDGVVRTNCMDCLDRTNVVQSMFGRYVLYRQLHERLGLTKATNNGMIHRFRRRRRTLPLELVVGYKQSPLSLPWIEAEAAHRYLWADNADAISRLYAGTPALKGDFTRTGKRTRRGAVDDGVNSLTRYYVNNFIDADRQEGMDLIVGSAEFNAMPNEVDDESTRIYMLQQLAKRRGYNEEHMRIKVDSDDDEEPRKLTLDWLPEDLRHHMRVEALQARAPMSSAADEEHLDAPTSSEFLLQVTSSAAGEGNPLNRDAITQPWWVSSIKRENAKKSDTHKTGKLLAQPTTLKRRYIIGKKRAVVTSLVLFLKAPILSAAFAASVIATELSRSLIQREDT